MKYLKTLLMLLHILQYLLVSFLARAFIWDPKKRRVFAVNYSTKKSRDALRVMDFQITIENPENFKAKNYMILANHMSYLDAFFVSSFQPSCFVTSMEMRRLPVLGMITELGGCLYVERRSKNNIDGEISQITEALKNGFNVIIFPEATSTNGEKVLPFKRSLLTAAVQAGVPILPMVIQYESIDGEKLNKTNRDSLCWYGDMYFAPHFFALQAKKDIRIRLKLLSELSVTGTATRDTLVDQAFEKISAAYEPIV